jgi:arylsulfatase A-like enzyme
LPRSRAVLPVCLLAVVALVAYLLYATPAVSSSTTCDRVSATTGSDTTGAGTSASPWRTAQKLADSLTPGQTGCLRAGTYSEDVTATDSGTAPARITIRSWPGEIARLNGRLTVQADFLAFSQLVLDGRSAGASGFGVTIEGDDVALMDNNITSRAAASCVNAGNQGTAAQRAYRLVLLRNRIHNCRTGVRIRAATNTAVLNNLIYDNVDRGVRLETDSFSSYVWRNVIDGNGEGVYLAGDATNASASNAIHANVISYSNSRWNIGSSFDAGNVGAYNHVWNNCLYATNPDASFNGSGGIVGASSTRGFTVYQQTLGEPQYADRDARDYHLATGSPCRTTSGDVAALLDGADSAPPDSAVPLKKPNVIVILTDDQRSEGTMAAMPKTLKWFQKGALEGGNITAGGTHFPEAIGTTPLCCPGRTSIMTGRYMHNHLVPHNQEEYTTAFDQSHTIQAYLGQPGADYYRGQIGRFITVNEWVGPAYYDRFWLSQGPYLPPIDVNDNGVRKVASQGIQEYSTTYYKDRALQFLNEADQGGQTFFLQLATYAPHAPYDADTPYNEANYAQSNFPAYTQTPAQLETDLSDKPSWVQTWDGANIFGTSPEGQRLKQLRTLKSVDDLIDEVFTQLEAQGNADDTLAFFTTDNGYNWNDHGLTAKSKPYIPGMQVPLLMRWPANPQVRRNFSDERLVANIDISPTVKDVTGLADDPGFPMDGVSLLDPTKTRTRILSEYAGDQKDPGETGPFWKVPPWASILTKDYHYIENYDSDGIVPTFQEFYDLNNDPYELNNLYGGDGDPSNDAPTNPPAATLSAQLAKDRRCRGTECPPGPGAPSTADNVAPRVIITAPKDNDIVVNKNVDIDVSAWDNLGVVGVTYKLDGIDLEPEDTAKPFTMSWNTTTQLNGQHVLSAVARDAAGNTTTKTLDVTVDNGGIDIQATSGGAVVGRPDTNDVITYSFGTPMDPASIYPGWTGAAQGVTVKVNPDQPLYGYDDTVTLLRSDNAAVIAPMGVIDLGLATYVGFYEPGARFLDSQMTMSADRRTVTVVLGTPSPQSSGTKPEVGSMTWHASSSAQTQLGQPFCACNVLEGITAGDIEDREF